MNALASRIDALARDVGRLRRRLELNGDPGRGGYLVDALVGHVESLDVMLEPTAADLVRRGFTVEQALSVVDGRAADLDRLLRGDWRARRE